LTSQAKLRQSKSNGKK